MKTYNKLNLMKSTLFGIAYILTVTTIFAQRSERTRHSFEIATLGGYEHNYFKSPEFIVQNGELLGPNELIASSVYQEVALDYDLSYRSGDHRLRFSISPNAHIFHEQYDDSYWSLNGSVKYDYDLSRKNEILAEAKFKRMNREGLDGAQDVLVNPLGYYLVGGSLGLESKFWRDQKTTSEVFYNYKNFDAYGTRDLLYHEMGIQIQSKQKLDFGGAQEHEVGVVAYAKKRRYQTFDASDEIPEGTRNWNYFKGTLYYELPLGKYLEVKPAFTYLSRVDVGSGRSGYNQFGPSGRIVYDDDKLRVKGQISWLNRDYTNIFARDEDGNTTTDFTNYTYLDLSFDLERTIANGLFLTVSAYQRVRETNFLDLEARSFRGYVHQYAGAGLKFEL